MGWMVEVTRSVLARMLAHAESAAPDECCGLLLGSGRRINEARATANVAPDPRTRFEIDPAALIEAYRAARSGGREVLGYYHSHPAGHPLPSATDRKHMSGDGRIWAIVAGRDISFWRDDGREFAPLSPRAIDG